MLTLTQIMRLFIHVIHYFAIQTVMLYGEKHSLFQNIVLVLFVFFNNTDEKNHFCLNNILQFNFY